MNILGRGNWLGNLVWSLHIESVEVEVKKQANSDL
jgi:hypothetical protein